MSGQKIRGMNTATNNMNNQYFVIMWQEEIEKIKNPIERATYEAIKSFCANGKKTAALSVRDIAERSGGSKSGIKKFVDLLIEKEMLEIVGTQVSMGGTVNIYKVSTTRTEKRRGVHHRARGVHAVGTKKDKVKSNIESNTNSQESFTNEEQVEHMKILSEATAIDNTRKAKYGR